MRCSASVCRLWVAVVLWSCVVHEAAPQDHSQPQPTHPGRTPHAVGHGLILLMMGVMMPETCWDRSLIINIESVASCWFSLFTLCNDLCRILWFHFCVFLNYAFCSLTEGKITVDDRLVTTRNTTPVALYVIPQQISSKWRYVINNQL